LINEGLPIRITMVDLPAVNTPQFDWARVHLRHAPRPLGRPIEPEVVAEAVFRAADGRWREYWLGIPTMIAILGNMVLPGYLDRYFARTAVTGQQSAAIVGPERRDNLDAPVTALHRTRGSFSAGASSRALLVPGEVMRAGIVAAGALLFFALGAGLRELSRSLNGRRLTRG
jgi:hypothetical protein